MRPPYAEHYYLADPPYQGGTCDGCGHAKAALAWRDRRAPDARLCGSCVPPEVTVAYVPARTYDRAAHRDHPDEQLPGQLGIELP